MMTGYVVVRRSSFPADQKLVIRSFKNATTCFAGGSSEAFAPFKITNITNLYHQKVAAAMIVVNIKVIGKCFSDQCITQVRSFTNAKAPIVICAAELPEPFEISVDIELCCEEIGRASV